MLFQPIREEIQAFAEDGSRPPSPVGPAPCSVGRAERGGRGGGAGRDVLTTLDHLVIAVRDLDAATATYASLLGRAPSWHGEHPGAGTANTLFRLDRTYAELLSPIGRGALGDALRAQLDRHGEGPYALAFGTDEAAACAAAWRARAVGRRSQRRPWPRRRQRR
jgi:catechol 2,3-dioxygenase-like lactoylglutathione lyase family enzyme